MLTGLILQYRYVILFPVALFEGPLVAFIVGTFVALGYFNPLLAYLILILGDVIPDTAYYFIGRYGEQKNVLKRYISKIGVHPEHFEVIRRLWERHPGKTMFFSKLAYGLSTPFLVSAGIVGMPLQEFLRYAVPITLVQYAVFMTLGYHFGALLGLVMTSFHDIQLLIAAVIVVAILYYLLTRYMRTRLLKSEQEVE